MTPIPMRALVLAIASMALAPAAHGQAIDPAVQAKILADPAYKAYEEKRQAILRSGLKGEAKFRALKALQEANLTVADRAFRVAGAAHLLSGSVRLLPAGIFALPFTMDGDTRVYSPPFSHRVANNGDANADGFVLAQADTFDGDPSGVTFRSYAGVGVTVPPGAVAMVVSVEVEVGHVDLYTDAVYTEASARATVMAEAKGSLPGDGFWDTLLIQQDAPALTWTHWGSYSNPGLKQVATTVVPVTPGQTAYAAGGMTAWVKKGWSSNAHVGASGTVRRIHVKFIYAPVAAPTPTLPPAMAVPTPVLITGAANKIFAGPADLALFALPAATGWPTELVVKNLGGKGSESTLVRAKVVLTQGDLDVVARNCRPRFVDFDEAVPALAPGASATIGLLTKLAPNALAAWNAVNKPALASARPVATPTPNPVSTIVTCRYHLTAELGKNQNLGDPHPENNTLTRDVVETVPLK